MNHTDKFSFAATQITPGAKFGVEYDYDELGSMPVALTANKHEILRLAISPLHHATVEKIIDALSEWSEAMSSNDALHRRLVQAEEALLRISAECDEKAREIAKGALEPK